MRVMEWMGPLNSDYAEVLDKGGQSHIVGRELN